MAHELMNILINHLHDQELKRLTSKYVHGRLIDIGCGNKPYKSIFYSYVSEHIGIDLCETIHNKSDIDIFANAYNIPVSSSSFDTAICTSVLEHLEEPYMALNECYRVLKYGGVAIYSVPFIWHLHEEPRDFYRFSKYGLKYLFEKTGFEIIELKALSGFWVTFGQLFVYNLYRFNRNIIKWTHIIDIIGIIIQAIAYFLDKVDKTEKWTCLYIITVRKN
jgi:SAM-dependent methyltransferase